MRGAAVAIVATGALLVAGCGGGSSPDPGTVAASLSHAIHRNDASLRLRNVACHQQADTEFNCLARLEHGGRSARVLYDVQLNRDGTFVYRAEF